MKSLLLVILLVACSDSDDSGFPVLVQGGNGNTGGAIALAGNVCLIGNIEVLTSCAVTGVGGLTVTLGNATAITNDDGSFALSRSITVTPTSTIIVSGPQIVPSLQLVRTTNVVVPVVGSDLFSQVLVGNSIVLEPGMGSIIAPVTNASGEPLPGITAISTPSSLFGPLFDTQLPGPLALTSTGNQGLVFFPGVVPGSANLSFINASNPTDQSTVSDVRVLEGGINFVNAVLAN